MRCILCSCTEHSCNRTSLTRSAIHEALCFSGGCCVFVCASTLHYKCSFAKITLGLSSRDWQSHVTAESPESALAILDFARSVPQLAGRLLAGWQIGSGSTHQQAQAAHEGLFRPAHPTCAGHTGPSCWELSAMSHVLSASFSFFFFFCFKKQQDSAKRWKFFP